MNICFSYLILTGYCGCQETQTGRDGGRARGKAEEKEQQQQQDIYNVNVNSDEGDRVLFDVARLLNCNAVWLSLVPQE